MKLHIVYLIIISFSRRFFILVKNNGGKRRSNLMRVQYHQSGGVSGFEFLRKFPDVSGSLQHITNHITKNEKALSLQVGPASPYQVAYFYGQLLVIRYRES